MSKTNKNNDSGPIHYLEEGGIPIPEARKLSEHLGEVVMSLTETFRNHKLYSEVENEGSRQKISSGITEKEMLKIPELVESIALAQAFKSYIDDAIQAYEQLRSEIRNLSIAGYEKLKGITFPAAPQLREKLTSGDYYGSLSVEENCRLLTLQARAATIGQFIHPKGRLSTEREKVMTAATSPVAVSGEGKETTLIETTAGIDIDTIDQMLFSLQEKHRDAQKRINTVKYECEQAVSESERQALETYQQEWREYEQRWNKHHAEYIEYTRAEDKRIQRLGVAIPHIFRHIYDTWC